MSVTATSIRPFRIEVPEEQLDELRRRIAATRWPSRELVADRSQGVQLATMQALARYWTTDYDWRVGVLGGRPLFAVHYLMAKRHWQIVNHDRAGKPVQGGIKTFTLKETPQVIVDTAVRAARCIGDGLYGVDLKETADGIYVIEINDNPNLDHGYEDSGEKDEVWTKLTQWFLDRLERHGRAVGQ